MAPNNPLPIHGNEKTMNLNHLLLTNIQSSPYFKVNLYDLKTYHEVIDEIYYKVSHLEPWEKGSRKTAGQTGMCGGVRGVGAGGIVSSAFCLVYKLFTLRLTRKQLMGLCNHADSPYIRGLGFMYIRYTQNPADFWDWFEEYLEDDEMVDVKAGGGHSMKIGDMLRQWLTKLEWYSTLFPRIPVPVQKSIEQKLKQYDLQHGAIVAPQPPIAPVEEAPAPQRERGGYGEPQRERGGYGEAQRERGGYGEPQRERGGYGEPQHSRSKDSPASQQRHNDRSRRPTPPFNIAKEFEKDSSSSSRRRSRSHSRSKDRHRGGARHGSPRERRRSRSPRDRMDRKERKRSRSPRDRSDKSDKKREHRSRSKDSHSRHKHKHKHRSHSKDRFREQDSSGRRESSFERDLRREKDRQKTKHRHRDDYK